MLATIKWIHCIFRKGRKNCKLATKYKIKMEIWRKSNVSVSLADKPTFSFAMYFIIYYVGSLHACCMGSATI